MPELTAAGWKVNVDRLIWTPIDAFQCMPEIAGSVCLDLVQQQFAKLKNKEIDIEKIDFNQFIQPAMTMGIVEALETAYQADRKAMVKVGRDFAMDYRWDKLLTEGWKPLLEQIEPFSYQPMPK